MDNKIKEILELRKQNAELLGIIDQFITIAENAKKALEKPSNP